MSQAERRRRYYTIIRSVGVFIAVLMAMFAGRRVAIGGELNFQWYGMVAVAVWALISAYRAHTQIVAAQKDQQKK